jgi:hypothetical protein
MAIVVEDGTIVTGANSYVTTAELTTYATARGVTISGDEEQLLIKAMDYLETLDFIGMKSTANQALQWPRAYVIIDGYYVDVTTIPTQLKKAQMAMALFIDGGNSLQPTVTADNSIKAMKVGDLEIEYKDGSGSFAVSYEVNNYLAKLINSNGMGQFKVSRA